MEHLNDLLLAWSSFYSNHAVVRTLVSFAHVAGLIAGGGLAVATDRSLLRALDAADSERRTLLENLASTHRLVVTALAVVTASGLLLFAADAQTFLYSRFFWTKMGLVALLLVNGLFLWASERRALAGEPRAWRALRTGAVLSMTLWFLTTLGGVALPNIG